MAQQARGEADTGYVRIFRAGEAVEGEFHCSECAYGISVYRPLPSCPMCGTETWEAGAPSPLTARPSAPAAS